MNAIASVVVLYAAYLGLWALGVAVLGRPRPLSLELGLKILQGLLVVEAVVDLVFIFTRDRPPSLVTHLGYLVASVALLPLLLSSQTQVSPETPRSPATGWDTGLVTVACLATAVVVVRLRMTA